MSNSPRGGRAWKRGGGAPRADSRQVTPTTEVSTGSSSPSRPAGFDASAARSFFEARYAEVTARPAQSDGTSVLTVDPVPKNAWAKPVLGGRPFLERLEEATATATTP